MAELAIRSVRIRTYADWLPSRTTSFSHRPASFGGNILALIVRQTNQIRVRFPKYLQGQSTKKVFEQNTKRIDKKNMKILTGKNKQVNPSRSLTKYKHR